MRQATAYTVVVIGANGTQNELTVGTKKEASRIAKSAIKAGAQDVAIITYRNGKMSVASFDLAVR